MIYMQIIEAVFLLCVREIQWFLCIQYHNSYVDGWSFFMSMVEVVIRVSADGVVFLVSMRGAVGQ